jgi:hypothetical protein
VCVCARDLGFHGLVLGLELGDLMCLGCHFVLKPILVLNELQDFSAP